MFEGGVPTRGMAVDQATEGAFGIDAAELGALEWRVVALARREADRFGRAAKADLGALRHRLGRLTGATNAVPQLADTRPEALRRCVCMARRADALMSGAAAALTGMGFSAGAIHAVSTAAAR